MHYGNGGCNTPQGGMSRYTAQQLDRLVDTVRTGRVPRMSHTPCSCRVNYIESKIDNSDEPREEITYCPLHAAAPELLAALKEARTMLNCDCEDGKECAEHQRFESVIVHAEGKE